MKNQLNKIKKSLFAICFISVLLLSPSAYALERLLVKDVIYGPEIMKQYSIVRTNGNDGFIMAGNTISTNGNQVIHVFRIDDNGLIQWNLHFQHDFNAHHQCTHIDTNVGGTGYILCGYTDFNANGTPRPFLLEINELGVELNLLFTDIPGVFSKVKATPKGNYVAVGYIGNDIEMYTHYRDGLVILFDNNLIEQWTFTYRSNFVWNSELAAPSLPLYMNRFDIVESVDAYMYGGEEYYVFGGTHTEEHGTDTLGVAYVGLINEQGHRVSENLFISNSQVKFPAAVSDVRYDPYSESVWVSFNDAPGLGNSTPIAHLMEIILHHPQHQLQAIHYEGQSTFGPLGFHGCYSNNIYVDEDYVWVFGYAVNDFYPSWGNQLCSTEGVEIPIIVKFDKTDITDPNNVSTRLFYNTAAGYCGYPNQFGNGLFSHAYQPHRIAAVNCPYFTPNVGLLFHVNETMHFAMLGYESVNTGSSGPWSLELISDLDNNFCQEYNPPVDVPSLFYHPFESTMHWYGPEMLTYNLELDDFISAFSSAEDCFGDDPNNLIPVQKGVHTSLNQPDAMSNEVLLFPNPSSGDFNLIV
jgi:hypothetical protein